MNKNYKIPFVIYVFFVLIYANQGISSLPSQCIYYLTRESWHLSATMIGLIGWITGLAWYVKPLWGVSIDYFPIKQYRAKYYLIFNCIALVCLYLFIMFFGFNLWSLIVILTLINICIGWCDVANDYQMVVLEQKHNLKGKIQAIQWIALGGSALIVTILGAKLALSLPEPINYKVAYGLAGIMPILILVYLFKWYKEKKVVVKKSISNIFKDLKKLKDHRFLFALLFIACLQFCPSFGTALMIKAREQLGIGKMFLGYLGATGTVLGIIGYALYYWKCYKFDMKKLLYFMIIPITK